MHFVLSAFLLLGICTHDIQVAFFKIHQEDTDLHIEFTFETDDLATAMDGQGVSLSDSRLEEYIESNFSISLNDKLREYHFESVETKKEHVIVRTVVSDTEQDISTVSIKNTCLTNIDGHSNIMEINLNGKQRDFLMNDRRTSIELKY